MTKSVLVTCFLLVNVVLGSRVSLRAQQPESFAEFKALEKSEFGSKLLNAVQAAMSDMGTLDKIVDTLNEMKSALLSEQQQADEERKEDLEWCSRTQDMLAKAIVNQMNVITTAQEVQKQKEVEIDDKLKELAEKAEELDANANNQRKATRDREVTAEVFSQNKQDHEESIKIIHDLRENIGSGKSFVEALGAFEKDTLAEQKGFENGALKGALSDNDVAAQEAAFKAKEYGTGVKVFSMLQMSDASAEEPKLDMGLVAELLGRIEKALEDSLTQFTNDEQASISGFNSLMDKLKRQREGLQSEQASLQSDLARTKAELESAKKLEENTKEELEETKRLKEENEKQCADKEAHYTAESARRTEELNILNQVINLVQERFIKMQEYLKARSEAAAAGESIDSLHTTHTSSIDELTKQVQQ